MQLLRSFWLTASYHSVEPRFLKEAKYLSGFTFIICIHTGTHTCTHTHTRAHKHTQTYTHTHTYTHMHTYIHTHTHTHTHTHIHTRTHTYTQAQTNKRNNILNFLCVSCQKVFFCSELNNGRLFRPGKEQHCRPHDR